MKYHPITKEITDLLGKNGCWFETFVHEPVRTSEEAAKVRNGYSLKQGAKALIVRFKNPSGEKKFVMVVMSGDLKFDKRKLKNFLGVKDLSLAAEDEVEDITRGVKIGGVPPFGNLFNLEVLADKSLFENEKIIFNAGDRCFSVAMKSDDYKNLVKPTICDIGAKQ